MTKRANIGKEILENWRKLFPRIGFEGFHYYEICSEADASVNELKSKIKSVHELKGFNPKDMKLLLQIRRLESVMIAFSAMCLEACIWDYAACGTSQNKATEWFKSLNLVGKWVIIPQFLSGSDITRTEIDSTCFLEKIRKLTKARNELVHPKSKPLPDNDKDAFNALRNKKKQMEARCAFGLIAPLLVELEKIDKTNWWFFESNNYINTIKKSLETPKTK